MYMAKPTVSEHRTNIRGLLSEATQDKFTDAEIDANLANALFTLSGYVVKLAKVNKTSLTAGQTVIDLSADCPAEVVVEVLPSGGTPVTEFRPRAAELVLKNQIGATSADFYYRAAYTHDGTSTDWYPPNFRGAVCMLAAAYCIIGRQKELSELDSLKANAIATSANRMFDTAIAIMSNKPASSASATYGRTY
jgi:hypothetical protein